MIGKSCSLRFVIRQAGNMRTAALVAADAVRLIDIIHFTVALPSVSTGSVSHILTRQACSAPCWISMRVISKSKCAASLVPPSLFLEIM